MSAEGAQHHQGQLSPQTQTVCPPPLWEALQGPPFPDQQVQEQLLPCGCHPAELCTTVIAPPTHTHPHTHTHKHTHTNAHTSHTHTHTPTPPPVTVLPSSTLAWAATHPPPATEHLQ